jgi:hypothetical protein
MGVRNREMRNKSGMKLCILDNDTLDDTMAPVFGSYGLMLEKVLRQAGAEPARARVPPGAGAHVHQHCLLPRVQRLAPAVQHQPLPQEGCPLGCVCC